MLSLLAGFEAEMASANAKQPSNHCLKAAYHVDPKHSQCQVETNDEWKGRKMTFRPIEKVVGNVYTCNIPETLT